MSTTKWWSSHCHRMRWTSRTLCGSYSGRSSGKARLIPRERVHAIEHDAAGDAVIPVGAMKTVRAVWVLGDGEVGAPSADLAGALLAEGPRVLHLAVLMPKELH